MRRLPGMVPVLDWVERRPTQVMLILVAASGVAMILMFAFTLRWVHGEVRDLTEQIKERRVESAERLQTAIVCLLAQQHDHRLNTQQGMEHLISLHGLEPPPPHAPPPLPDLPSGVEGCAPFANDGE